MLSPNLASRLADSFAYLDFTLPTVEENLALDEALLLAAEERGGVPVLRVWESPVTTVVLGAVDDIEALTTGLSGKIWQKIRMLDSGRVARA